MLGFRVVSWDGMGDGDGSDDELDGSKALNPPLNPKP